MITSRKKNVLRNIGSIYFRKIQRVSKANGEYPEGDKINFDN